MYNIDCQVKCAAVIPRQMYCNVTEHSVPGHVYCTTTINNRQYKYLHHPCNSTIQPSHSKNVSGNTTSLRVCEVYPDTSHTIINRTDINNMCFKCNTGYFAFLYRYYNGII